MKSVVILQKTFVGLMSISLSISVAQAQVKTAAESSFGIRLELRQNVDPLQAVQAKETMRLARYAEDLFFEALAGNQRIELNAKSVPAFSTPESILMNPAVSASGAGSLTFQSGDLLLMRGTSTISTTIATISDSPSQFSHVAMVYVDLDTQIQYAVEALLDKGVLVHPLEEVLKEGTPRMVLYRHQNQKLAASAGLIAYNLAKNASLSGHNYPYDFKFNMNEYSSLYCAELVRMAFDVAANGQTMTSTLGAQLIPKFPSTLGVKFANTLASIGNEGMKISTFAPSDLDLENSFQLVAEWRDAKATLNSRIKDQILLQLFSWIELGSVEFDYAKILRIAKSTAASSRAQAESNAEASSGIDAQKMKKLADAAELIVNDLAAQILKINDIQLKISGRNMSADEIRSYIESLRADERLKKILRARGFAIKSARSCKSLF